MEEEEKEHRANFTLVGNCSIWPFYLGMNFIDFLGVIDGWDVGQIVFDRKASLLNLVASVGESKVDIAFLVDGDVEGSIIRILSISSYNAIDEHGEPLGSLPKDELINRFGLKFDGSDIDLSDESLFTEYYSSADGMIEFFINSHELSLLRLSDYIR